MHNGLYVEFDTSTNWHNIILGILFREFLVLEYLLTFVKIPK